MNIDEIKCNISHLLEDRGLTREYKEQAVRLLLYHLYVALDIYRYMTLSEKNKAGFWYRTFKNSYRLTGFFKERKEKREKKNSPLHPSYKEKSGVVGKDYKLHIQQGGDASLFEIRQKEFWDACLKFEPEYDRQLLLKFYCYWAEQVNGTELMLWETKKSWNMRLRLKAWSKKSYQLDDEAATLRLERAKGKMTKQSVNTQELQAIAAKRAEDNARLEQEIKERKQGAVSYEEYLKMKHES